MADVNETGEVTVEGQFVGKIEGFRFRQDQNASVEEAKTIRAASIQALAPQFHLRADRFYNAPDTEIDFTEQGGLMWGSAAVGKLIKGDDALKPKVVAFVDDEAGTDVAEKVQRRLQHFIDRKITTVFEPMKKLQNDTTLTGLAKGFAFRLVECFGVAPRGDVADEVKALEQDARGALRKHGVRFGQFTIFMPLLLKPSPTRLRLVLWSLSKGLQDFPEAPPPGLVTVSTAQGLEAGAWAMSGYRAAGERAIRIDMLERLADMLRDQNTRAGFEATPDMLSITGMTLVQFSDLMNGLGYKSEKGEREKVRAAVPFLPLLQEPKSDYISSIISETTLAVAQEDVPETSTDEPVPQIGSAEQIEIEAFYTFTWAPKRSVNSPQGNKPQRKGPPKGKRGAKPVQVNKSQPFAARPLKKEKAIDPDNPFAAALAGLKRD